jgi:hypothetical protein
MTALEQCDLTICDKIAQFGPKLPKNEAFTKYGFLPKAIIDPKLVIFKARAYHFAQSGPNPPTSIYNAGVVNFYSATGSLARFEDKNILCYFEEHSSLLQRSVVAVNSKVAELAPGHTGGRRYFSGQPLELKRFL